MMQTTDINWQTARLEMPEYKQGNIYVYVENGVDM